MKMSSSRSLSTALAISALAIAADAFTCAPVYQQRGAALRSTTQSYFDAMSKVPAAPTNEPAPVEPVAKVEEEAAPAEPIIIPPAPEATTETPEAVEAPAAVEPTEEEPDFVDHEDYFYATRMMNPKKDYKRFGKPPKKDLFNYQDPRKPEAEEDQYYDEPMEPKQDYNIKGNEPSSDLFNYQDPRKPTMEEEQFTEEEEFDGPPPDLFDYTLKKDQSAEATDATEEEGEFYDMEDEFYATRMMDPKKDYKMFGKSPKQDLFVYMPEMESEEHSTEAAEEPKAEGEAATN